MTKSETIAKIRDHLGKARARALMMANAPSATDRSKYLKQMSDEMKKGLVLLDKVELMNE